MIKRNDKSYNKSQIAKYINMKGETSKPEIASELGISMPTVLQNVKELIQSGIVAEAGKYESTGGRKASVLSISANLKNAVGIDINGLRMGKERRRWRRRDIRSRNENQWK